MDDEQVDGRRGGLSRRQAIGAATAVVVPAVVASTRATAQPNAAAREGGDGGPINVKSFGARGDSNASASAGNDDTAAIQAAIDHIDRLGGGTLYFPEGHYRVTSYLTLCRNLRISGAGRAGTTLVTATAGGGSSRDQDVRNGTLLYSNWRSNGSTSANIDIENIGFISTHPGNAGAAFYDNCGSHIRIRNVLIHGFKYGIIFDQTEIADIYDSTIAPTNAGGACVWLVNSSLLKPGNRGTFTNRVGVHNCQLSGGHTVNLIQDDGGYTHVYANNNYNGGAYHLRIAGTQAFTIIGGEYEGSKTPIYMGYLASDGKSGVGAPHGEMIGGLVAGGGVTGQAATCTFVGTEFASQAYPVSGARDGGWTFIGCSTHRHDHAFTDTTNCYLYVSQAPNTVRTNRGQARWAIDGDFMGGITKCSNPAGNVATIPPDSKRAFPLGVEVTLEQATPTGAASFAGGPGVVVVGPTSTSGQYQRLKAIKIGPNSWQTELSLQTPRAAAQRDSSAPDVAALRSDFNALLSKLRAAGLLAG